MSANVVTLTKDDEIYSLVSKIVSQDLGRLSEAERNNYFLKLCEYTGVNCITLPFEYIKFQGKMILYANKACAEQLRILRGISVEIKSREFVDDLYIVTARGQDKTGRYDESIGSVSVAGLRGLEKANAIMKAETKAKRRVTLSLAGLGILDESEIETMVQIEKEVQGIEENINLITEIEVELLKGKLVEAEVEEIKICNAYKIESIEDLTMDNFQEVMRKLQKTINKKSKLNEVPINKILERNRNGEF